MVSYARNLGLDLTYCRPLHYSQVVIYPHQWVYHRQAEEATDKPGSLSALRASSSSLNILTNGYNARYNHQDCRSRIT
jgi:hypothetical protein